MQTRLKQDYGTNRTVNSVLKPRVSRSAKALRCIVKLCKQLFFLSHKVACARTYENNARTVAVLHAHFSSRRRISSTQSTDDDDASCLWKLNFSLRHIHAVRRRRFFFRMWIIFLHILWVVFSVSLGISIQKSLRHVQSSSNCHRNIALVCWWSQWIKSRSFYNLIISIKRFFMSVILILRGRDKESVIDTTWSSIKRKQQFW